MVARAALAAPPLAGIGYTRPRFPKIPALQESQSPSKDGGRFLLFFSMSLNRSF